MVALSNVKLLWSALLFMTVVNFLEQSKQVSRLVTVENSTRALVKGSENKFEADLKGCEPTTVPNNLLIPIFILVRDRLTSLKTSLESYKNFTSPHEIIVLDHNSSYPPMLDYLKELNDTNEAQVHHLEAHDWDGVLKESNKYMQNYMLEKPEIKYYVFTDADIAFLRSAPDTLLFYAGVLSSCKHINVVGPQLQISDIPDMYSEKGKVLHGHGKAQSFWITPPSMATWNKIGYHIGVHPIDTTFAMRRSEYQFARLQGPAVRAFAPHAAVHVDWYYNSSSMPEDKIWYKDHLKQATVSHWRQLEK